MDHEIGAELCWKHIAMTAIAELLDSADSAFVLLGGEGGSGRRADRVIAVDGLAELAAIPSGAVVLVPPHCITETATYELDVAVRVASDRGAAAVVLVGAEQLPVTVKQLADRARVAVFGTSSGASLVELIRQLDRIMGRGESAVVERATDVIAWARTASEFDDYTLLVREAETRLGTELRVRWFGPQPARGEPVIIGGWTVGWASRGSHDDRAAELALPSVAAAIGRCYERLIVGEEASGDAIANLIGAPGMSRGAIADRARAAGVEVDTRHVVVCISGSRSADPGEIGGLLAHRHRRILATIALRERLPDAKPTWSVTRIDNDVGLVWSQNTSDNIEPDRTSTIAEGVMEVLHGEYPESQFFAGVGSAGWGVDGLCRSALEARAAARSAAAQGISGRTLHVVGSQLEQLLSELVTSSISHRVIEGVLAPLSALPEHSRYATIQTLSTYLDLQGSRTRAASVLHLHPNGVGHRIKKVIELLDVDLNDPDTRFIVQLACRVWLISRQRETTAAA